MDPVEKVNILLVDDRADKLKSLEAILADLGQNLVCAESGKEALRHALVSDFAVILLDVNMPVMDGFETASLIRSRRRSEHTPIIFITSYHDTDNLMTRGYSLGAVDYILAPVIPEVLRAKVGVFVDLSVMTAKIKRQADSLQKSAEEVRSQADALRRRANQLHRLTEASIVINSELSIERMMQFVVDTARDVIGAHRAVMSTTESHYMSAAATVTSGDAPRLEAWEKEINGADLDAQVCNANKALRLTQGELDARMADPANTVHSIRGWLAAPLTGRDARNIGLIRLCDKMEGEFTTDDEAILIQIAQMASIAIENTINSQAREANRLKDEFLAMLSHELRTPLTAMLGWTRLLQTGKLDPATVARGLDVIDRNVKAQGKLIEDLLDVSRIVTGKLHLNLRPVDLVPVLEAAIDSVKLSSEGKGIQLTRDFKSIEFAQVSGDPDRLQQAVWNLITNAIKFTPRGGKVEIRAALEGLSHARIEVIDNGMGIPTKFLPFLFERFRQADSSSTRSHGGLGIGLSLVRSIVDLHGGQIRAESKGEGHGAKFTIRLPIRVAPPRAAMSTPASSTATLLDGNAPLSGVRVLVVDDELDTRDLLQEVVRSTGADVLVAGSAHEALDIFCNTPPMILVSDIGMPGEDGYALIRRVRAMTPEQGGRVPAVALTAYAREEDRVRALSMGFDAHMPKPIEPVSLIEILTSFANRMKQEPQVERAS